MVIAKGQRIVLDHLSFNWAGNYLLALIRYGGMAWSTPISDVSIQHTLLSEVLAAHPTAFVVGTNEELKDAEEIGLTNVSIHRNLMAHNSHRNPMLAADNALVANNVVYNWRLGSGMMNRRGVVDWVNNVGKAGPMTLSSSEFFVGAYCNELGGNFSIFASGNIGPANEDHLLDNWEGKGRQVACYRDTGESPAATVPEEWYRALPQDWGSAAFPVELIETPKVLDRVLEDVGANARLTCDGLWTSNLDSVDQRVILDVRTLAGPALPPEVPPAYGAASDPGAPCADRDGDGLPDAWESRHYGCPTCAEPGQFGSGGYLVIEHYLNGTPPTRDGHTLR